MEMLDIFHHTLLVPMNRPDILVDVPAMLLSATGPLALKWNYVPKMIPWLSKIYKKLQ